MYFGILNEALLQPQKINPKLRKYQNGPLSYWVFLSRRKCVGLLYCLSAHEDIGHILQSSLILSLRSLLLSAPRSSHLHNVSMRSSFNTEPLAVTQTRVRPPVLLRLRQNRSFTLRSLQHTAARVVVRACRSRAPAHRLTWSCAAGRLTSATISVQGCSTCRRGFNSRK